MVLGRLGDAEVLVCRGSVDELDRIDGRLQIVYLGLVSLGGTGRDDISMQFCFSGFSAMLDLYMAQIVLFRHSINIQFVVKFLFRNFMV